MLIVVVIVIALIIFALFYNSLISKVNQIKNAEGSLNACLKQRADLIPNLVEIAKQYMEHEEKIFTKIIELRNQASQTHTLDQSLKLDQKINQELKSFMVNVENYPQLLSNQNFVKIQEALIEVEDNIAASRRFYNTAIVMYNESLQAFPTNIVSNMMGLKEKEIFTISEAEKEVPNLKQLFKK